jgi:hypothetical protein
LVGRLQPAAGCFRGSFGEALLAVTTANNVIAAAEADMTTLREQHAIAMKSCLDMSETYGSIAELEAAHREHMKQLRAALTRARSILAERSRFKSVFTLDPLAAGAGIGGLISDAIGTGDGPIQQDALRLEEQMAIAFARVSAAQQHVSSPPSDNKTKRSLD